ncbi:MAG: apolipoprotein N-acyltransferase [Myxococcales bacterium]|nr:apolipoprotein N-acyltransferase [Myxococcales bacterium]
MNVAANSEVRTIDAEGTLSRAARALDRPSAAARGGLALLGASLFALCFPPLDLGFAFGWVALVPLAIAVRGLRGRHAAIVGALFGFAGAQLVFSWMYRFEAFHVWHGALLAGYVAVWPALFGVALARWGTSPRGLLYVPAAGAIVEWARGHAGFLALPWGTFGQTQHRDLPILQLAALGGELVVGMVVVAVNVAIAQLVIASVKARTGSTAAHRRPALLVLAGAAALHLVGVGLLYRPASGKEITVAAIQPAVPPGERTEAQANEALERLGDLSRAAASNGARLVVWPESSVERFETDLSTKLAVRDIVEDIGAPVVVGSSHVEKLGRARPGNAPAVRPSNAAFVMVPGQPVAAPYKKVRLLPFGEYRPVDLPEWIAPRFFDTERGARHMTMQAGDVTIEPIICWENLFADEVRASATDAPTVITHIVNDAWFGPTQQPALHNLVSAVRAAESNRPVVVASNMGRSQIVDARGRVVARASRFWAPDHVTATVRMPSGQTPFRRYGDWTWALPLGLVLSALRVRDRLGRQRG